MLKSQQRFRNEKHSVFTERDIKIVFTSNDDKRIQSIDSVETCWYQNCLLQKTLQKKNTKEHKIFKKFLIIPIIINNQRFWIWKKNPSFNLISH